WSSDVCSSDLCLIYNNIRRIFFLRRKSECMEREGVSTMAAMDAVNWLTEEEQRLWRSFLTVNSLLQERLDRDLRRRNGLTLVEYGILVHLSEAEGRRMRMRTRSEEHTS